MRIYEAPAPLRHFFRLLPKSIRALLGDFFSVIPPNTFFSKLFASFTTLGYTPNLVMRKMLELAEVGPNDTVYDLGCGDGRTLITACKIFGARKCVGYEIRSSVYRTAVESIKEHDLQDKIRILNTDLYSADLSNASVIIVFISPAAVERLKRKLAREAMVGTRIVSFAYEFRGWKPQAIEAVQGDIFYLYHIPDRS